MSIRGNCLLGKLLCMAFAVCGLLATAAFAQTYTMLDSFCLQSAPGCSADGAYPAGGLVQGIDGNLYGTASEGGTYNFGTLFKMTPSGVLSTLYNFCPHGRPCADGESPAAGLVQVANGDFYGTTQIGGAGCTYGCGTVFKITHDGQLTTLHQFCLESGCVDGAAPSAALVQGADGYLYGTTAGGGVNNSAVCFQVSGTTGCGTAFKIGLDGSFKTLYTFCSQSGCEDGAQPYAALVQATDGYFYGTTELGGASSYNGTVFRMTPGGDLTTLYSFCSQAGCADGSGPSSRLVPTPDGFFYGTTLGGGVNAAKCENCGGTVFKITAAGLLTTLYSFCSQDDCADGYVPYAGIVRGSDGNFYGGTSFGGSQRANPGGTLYRMSAGGKIETLYRFLCGEYACPEGSAPEELLQDTNGSFYGTTGAGGAAGLGTAFELSAGLSAFVEARPSYSAPGATVEILGTGLNGATSVSFNGVAAAFKVVSSSLIAAMVPAGATSGTIQVLTPTAALSSNVPFKIQP
jgi:uncharacterized repeat protein (TIGR03803 family)